MLSEKELEIAKEYALICNISTDELIDQLNKLTDEFQKALENIRNIFIQADEIDETIKFEKRFRRSWKAQKDIIKNHQVIDRKPMFLRIRNNI